MIEKYPSSVLSRSTSEVRSFDVSLKKLVEMMAEEMYSQEGVGLAANQVGIDASVIIVDPSGGQNKDAFRVMVNPVLTLGTKKVTSKEGCLSVPGTQVEVKRSETCVASYDDIEGNRKEETFAGFESFIVQHEVDHLHGLTILDRIPIKKREQLLRRRRENQ